jgi:hypothetical protein
MARKKGSPIVEAARKDADGRVSYPIKAQSQARINEKINAEIRKKGF